MLNDYYQYYTINECLREHGDFHLARRQLRRVQNSIFQRMNIFTIGRMTILITRDDTSNKRKFFIYLLDIMVLIIQQGMVLRHIYPSDNSPHRVKCHKMIMIYPQPVLRHYHPKCTLITLPPVSYLRSLVLRAVHRHRTGVDSFPAGRPIVENFFLTVPG